MDPIKPKIAHVAIVTPSRAGLYETTRELVAAERILGADARIVDPAPTKFHPGGDSDRGAVLADPSFVMEADLIVDHSGCDGLTTTLSTPHILMAHGRPRSSFLSEASGKAPVYSYHHKLAGSARYRAVVTFWPEHKPYLSAIFRTTPIYSIPPCVDLTYWRPSQVEKTTYQFPNGGSYNVVIADPWRDDSDPFYALHAFALSGPQIPGAKLHLYGRQGDHAKGWPALLKALRDQNLLGEVKGWTNNLLEIYRAADLLISCNSIATRTVRESAAVGLQSVTATPNIHQTAQSIIDALHKPQDGSLVRQLAERDFDALNTARAFLSIAATILAGNPTTTRQGG